MLRHILDYIRILARIRPKNRILTTPGTVPLVVCPEGLSNVLLAPTQSTGLAPRVDNRIVVQRVGLAIEHYPVVPVVHHNLGRDHLSRWRRGCLSRPTLRLRTGCEEELRREPRVNTPG